MKYWQWSSERSCVRITRCISVSMSSYAKSEKVKSCCLHFSVEEIDQAYLDEIDFGESIIAAGFLDIKDGYNVLVVEVSQQLHLTQGSEAEHRVIKGSNLLDGHLLAGRLVKSGAG